MARHAPTAWLCYNAPMTILHKALALPALALALYPLASRAQTPAPEPPAMFPFVIPWDDAAPGTATDVSFLNTKPAGAHGFIMSRGGHFVESATGTRVRFLGVSIAAHDAFPDHADAEAVAARLAKYGINIVRLHHMDNNDWGPNAHIWDDSFPDRRHINPAQLDKLDYFIAQLKKNGIYVDLNLHVSRQFTPADGFPASVSQISFGYDKRVDNYDARMISLQKEYARQLLLHVNPYTHLTYAQDPCVAVVEINNENSLVGDPWATLGADLDTLPEPFRGELVGLWNGWLAKKYGTDARLRAAWLRGVTPPGPALLTDTSEWTTEQQGTAKLDSAILAGSVNPADPPMAPPQEYTVIQVDGTDWHVQSHITGLNFQDGKTYTVSFQAKADAPRPMPVAAGLDEADWHNIGLAETANLTTDWQTFRYTFTAQGVVSQHGRVAFTLGGQTGTVDIDGLQVKPGAEGAVLQPGQSLTTKTVDIPASATVPQHADWLLFLADTERAYADGMRDYLKDTLHVHANLIDSQISWGGLSGPNREANMDFADNHAYWQHPSFPGKPWDPVNWTIPNTPMVADLASGGGGTLRDLAEYRIAGKPYSVSEYNDPAPSDYQCETVPELASFAAFQDWDMVYLFDYGSYGTGGSNDKIDGYFGVGSNPAKWAFFPAAALIFRAQELPPAAAPAVLRPVRKQFPASSTAAQLWQQTGPDDKNFLSRRLTLALTRPGQSGTQYSLFPYAALASPQQGVEPELQVTTTSSGPLYVAESPSVAAIVGFVGGQTVKTQAAVFTFPAFGDNFAAVTLTPLDGKPVAQSHHLLLTLVGKVENQGMQWNATHTSVGDQWGHGPTMAEGIIATVSVAAAPGTREHMYPLDGTGKRMGEVPSFSLDDGATPNPPSFTVGPQYQTVWYEIVE